MKKFSFWSNPEPEVHMEEHMRIHPFQKEKKKKSNLNRLRSLKFIYPIALNIIIYFSSLHKK